MAVLVTGSRLYRKSYGSRIDKEERKVIVLDSLEKGYSKALELSGKAMLN